MARRRKSKGLGDTVEKIMKATGIKKAAEAITDDCGCEERKEKLNKLFPYHKNLTMTDSQRSIWSRVRGQLLKGVNVNHSQRETMRLLYNDVFGIRYRKPTTCSTCLVKMRDELETVYQNTCEDEN
jgi:hypothetical protein